MADSIGAGLARMREIHNPGTASRSSLHGRVGASQGRRKPGAQRLGPYSARTLDGLAAMLPSRWAVPGASPVMLAYKVLDYDTYQCYTEDARLAETERGESAMDRQKVTIAVSNDVIRVVRLAAVKLGYRIDNGRMAGQGNVSGLLSALGAGLVDGAEFSKALEDARRELGLDELELSAPGGDTSE